MRNTLKQTLLAAATLLLLLPASSGAQPKGPKARKEARKGQIKELKEARKEKVKARKEARQDLKEAHKNLKEARKEGTPEERKEARQDLKEARKGQRETRKASREARRQRIRQGYTEWRQRFQERAAAIGNKLKIRRAEREASREERRKTWREKMGARLGKIKESGRARRAVRLHAWRAAKLERLEDIARGAGNNKKLERIEALKKKNEERLEKRLAKLEKDPGVADEPTPGPASASEPVKEEGGEK